MPIITLPNAELFYTHHRPAYARCTLLLIHGAGGSHLSWPSELRRLPQTAVYAIDLAGHGRSAPPGHSNIAAYVQDINDFIKALNLQNVVLLGHSMGGAIAQLGGLRPLPAVVGLILLGTGAKLRVSPTILASIETDYEQAVAQLNQFYWGGGQSPALMQATKDQLLACPARVTADDFLACDHFDFRARLAEITLPTLIISGSRDQMTPPKFGEFLAAQIPQAEFALIDQAGHMMALEFPGQVSQLVTNFLGKVTGGNKNGHPSHEERPFDNHTK